MKWKISKGFISQKIGKKLTIFDGEESALYTFNETASLIFGKLKKGFEKDKIIGLLIKKYKINKKKAEKDVNEFLNELKKNKIISSLKKKKSSK